MLQAPAGLVELLAPIACAVGMDPVHFGIMLMLSFCIGLLTPPVGSVLFG